METQSLDFRGNTSNASVFVDTFLCAWNADSNARGNYLWISMHIVRKKIDPETKFISLGMKIDGFDDFFPQKRNDAARSTESRKFHVDESPWGEWGGPAESNDSRCIFSEKNMNSFVREEAVTFFSKEHAFLKKSEKWKFESNATMFRYDVSV